MPADRYVEPGWFTRNVFNLVAPRGVTYLKRWRMEVGVFFDGVGAADADDAELERIAPHHPVFRIDTMPRCLVEGQGCRQRRGRLRAGR